MVDIPTNNRFQLLDDEELTQDNTELPFETGGVAEMNDDMKSSDEVLGVGVVSKDIQYQVTGKVECNELNRLCKQCHIIRVPKPWNHKCEKCFEKFGYY